MAPRHEPIWARLKFALALILAPGLAMTMDIDLKGNVELELRSFPKAGRHAEAEQDFAALAVEFEMGLLAPDGTHALIVKPFARYTSTTMSAAILISSKYRCVNNAFEAGIMSIVIHKGN